MQKKKEKSISDSKMKEIYSWNSVGFNTKQVGVLDVAETYRSNGSHSQRVSSEATIHLFGWSPWHNNSKDRVKSR